MNCKLLSPLKTGGGWQTQARSCCSDLHRCTRVTPNCLGFWKDGGRAACIPQTPLTPPPGPLGLPRHRAAQSRTEQDQWKCAGAHHRTEAPKKQMSGGSCWRPGSPPHEWALGFSVAAASSPGMACTPMSICQACLFPPPPWLLRSRLGLSASQRPAPGCSRIRSRGLGTDLEPARVLILCP